MIKSQEMAKSQSGFTLIELVVVIVILGILAAFAVPRFMGMEGRARVSTIQGLAGSLRSASAMAHGVWLADGRNLARLAIEGQQVDFTNGYPDRATVNRLIQDTSGFTFVAGTGQFTKNGAPIPANCSVTYRNAPAVNIPPPAPVVVTNGCGQ